MRGCMRPNVRRDDDSLREFSSLSSIRNCLIADDRMTHINMIAAAQRPENFIVSLFHRLLRARSPIGMARNGC